MRYGERNLSGDSAETLAALEQNSADAVSAVSTLRAAREAAKTVKAADFADQSLAGPAVGAAIEAEQIKRVGEIIE